MPIDSDILWLEVFDTNLVQLDLKLNEIISRIKSYSDDTNIKPKLPLL